MTVQGSEGYELTWDDIVQRLQVTADVPLTKKITSDNTSVIFGTAEQEQVGSTTFYVVRSDVSPGVFNAGLAAHITGSPVTILNVYLE